MMNKYNSKGTFHLYKYKKNKFEIVYVNKDFIKKDIHLRVASNVKNYPRPLKTSKQIWQTPICHRKNLNFNMFSAKFVLFQLYSDAF